MIRIALLLITAGLASCSASAPMPVPPIPPRVVVIQKVTPPPAKAPDISGLRTAYDDTARRLRTYLALGPCVPSGPTACADLDQARVANEAQRVAHDALAKAGTTAAVRVASLRVAAFQAVMGSLEE